MSWIISNIGTIIVIVAVVAIVAGVIISILRDKKAGKSTCGSNCAHCALHGQCHPQSQDKKNV